MKNRLADQYNRIAITESVSVMQCMTNESDDSGERDRLVKCTPECIDEPV